MKRIATALLFILSACSSAPSAPTVNYTAIPVNSPKLPIPRPGSQVMVADWTVPLSANGICSDVPNPFHCDLAPGSAWGLIQASDLPKFSVANGQLNYATDPLGGMALMSASALDHTKPMSIEETVRVDTLNCAAGVSYVGPVLYGGGADDGDPTGNYFALYISCFGGDQAIKLWMYSPLYAGALPNSPIIAEGSTHALRIDWYPGDHVDYLMDGQKMATIDATFGHGVSLAAPHDPHPSLWFGSSTGSVQRFDVYAGP